MLRGHKDRKVRTGQSIVINHLEKNEKFLTVEVSGGDFALFSKNGSRVATRAMKEDGNGRFFNYKGNKYYVA